MKPLVLFQICLAFVTVKDVQANHRCFVCLPNTGSSISDVLQMFPEGTVIPLCNGFDTDDPKYVRECPSPSHQGCLTQTNGSHVTKMCTELSIEDCKTANKINYCYCSENLCNKESVTTEEPVLAPVLVTTDDDEDSASEGSGSSEGFDSRQLETSSESDLNIEIIRKRLPTTTKSVILTTPRPDDSASAKCSVQAVNFLYVVSFLLVLRVNFL